MEEKIDIRVAQLRLMVVWLTGVAPSFALMIVRTIGPDSLNIQKVWGWLLAAVMPTLSLVVGTYAAAAHQTKINRLADRLFFRITIGLSLAYLVILTVTILFYPLGTDDAMKLLDNMSLILGPLQGLVSASLGVFFATNRAREVQ